jgi:hypothetical protein
VRSAREAHRAVGMRFGSRRALQKTCECKIRILRVCKLGLAPDPRQGAPQPTRLEYPSATTAPAPAALRRGLSRVSRGYPTQPANGAVFSPLTAPRRARPHAPSLSQPMRSRGCALPGPSGGRRNAPVYRPQSAVWKKPIRPNGIQEALFGPLEVDCGDFLPP